MSSEDFQNFLQNLVDQIKELSTSNGTSNINIVSSLSNRISEFDYIPDEDQTFENWFKRYQARN